MLVSLEQDIENNSNSVDGAPLKTREVLYWLYRHLNIPNNQAPLLNCRGVKGDLAGSRLGLSGRRHSQKYINRAVTRGMWWSTENGWNSRGVTEQECLGCGYIMDGIRKQKLKASNFREVYFYRATSRQPYSIAE